MANLRHKKASAQRVAMLGGIDTFMRIVAFFMGCIFLAAFHRFSKIADLQYALILSHTLLMFMFVFSSLKHRFIFNFIILISATLAFIDFGIRGLPSLQRESYPHDIVMIYIFELIVIAWFTYMLFVRKTTIDTELFVGENGTSASKTWDRRKRMKK